jgi:hypothetical protein
MSRRATWVVVVVILAVIVLVPLGWQRVVLWAVGLHLRSTTRELAAWEKEYGHVDTWQEADRAIEMLEYVRGYYVPGPGYRSDAQAEAALEAQRARTLAAIAEALRDFTGEDLGTDAARWRGVSSKKGLRGDKMSTGEQAYCTV